MKDIFSGFLADLIGRLDGPFSFRFVLQPVMAMIYAARDGLRDSREGRPPYLWTIFRHPEDRRALLHDGWKAITRLALLGVVLDTVYQLVVLHSFHPLQIAVVVFALALAPYALMRGLVARVATVWSASRLPRKPRSLPRETHV